jgi:hypothetical protein
MKPPEAIFDAQALGTLGGIITLVYIQSFS